ncbi:MAG: NnrU family protein [Acidiferrobacterales bacterium]
MSVLILGLVVFLGIHLVPTFSDLRQGLIQRFGERGYKGVFAAISLAGLILIIVGKGRADFVPLWQPPVWGRHIAPLLMLLAFVLLSAAYLPSNVKRFTAHPMLWAVTLWSAAHLLANGDLASLLLFGTIGLFALFDMVSANMRGDTKSKTRYALTKDVIAVAIGLVAYVVLVVLHPYLFGVPVFA